MHVSIQVLQDISNVLYDTTVKVNCSSSKTIKLCLMEKNIYCASFFLNLEMWNYPYSQFSVALDDYCIGQYRVGVSNAKHGEP